MKVLAITAFFLVSASIGMSVTLAIFWGKIKQPEAWRVYALGAQTMQEQIRRDIPACAKYLSPVRIPGEDFMNHAKLCECGK